MPALTATNDIIRARNVAASEVGALLDKHPYSTPWGIYDRLKSEFIIRVEQSEAMRLGQYFEPYIARYAAQKLGLKLRANTRTRELPHVALCATADYYVVGHPYLVEVKLSNKQFMWTEETLQPYIEWQARAQMAVYDRDLCIIAALVGSTFYIVYVQRDAAKEKLLLDTVHQFMQNHVYPSIRPIEPAIRMIAQVEAS